MALIKCKECGKQISSLAASCPQCGAPNAAGSVANPPQPAEPTPVAKKKEMSGCAIVILLMVVIVVIAIIANDVTSCSDGAKTSPPAGSLNATVRFTGTEFVIVNKDSFDWQNCQIEVNSHTFSSGYSLNGATILAHQVESIESLQLANGDGERFNPFTQKPQNLYISCDIPAGGKASAYVEWK